MNHSLQVHSLLHPSLFLEIPRSQSQILGQAHTRESPQRRRGEESQASLALKPPQLPVDIDDAVPKQIPGALLEEVALLKDALVPEDEVQVARVADDDARREGRDRDAEGLIAKEPLAAGEPRKEALTGLQEEDSVPYDGEGVGRFPGGGGESV